MRWLLVLVVTLAGCTPEDHKWLAAKYVAPELTNADVLKTMGWGLVILLLVIWHQHPNDHTHDDTGKMVKK
jgi:hypothetical protein